MPTKLSRFCDAIIEGGWLAVLVATPMFFNVYSARTFEPDKLTLLRSIATIMVVAWVIKVLEEFSQSGTGASEERTIRERFTAWIGRPLVLPTLVIVVVYVITTATALSFKVSLWGSYQRLQGTYTMLSYIVVFALALGGLRTRYQLNRLVTTVILTSVPVGLYGIVQHYGLDPLPWAGDVVQRVASNMGNPIFVASYMIMVMPLTLARIVENMIVIVGEEEVPWKHTFLAAAYIFVLAVQTITVIFSRSRGPMLGAMAGGFFMVLLGLLLIRQTDKKGTRPVSPRDFAMSAFEVILPPVLGLLGGWALSFAWVPVPEFNAATMAGIGVIFGLATSGLLVFAWAAIRRNRQRLWLNWLLLSVVMGAVLIPFNMGDMPWEPMRNISYLERLAHLFQPGEGTGKVRILIWGGAIQMMFPHEQIGIPDEYTDALNPVRPLIGYGPESMFNAFAKFYPAELATWEKRGSSADRSHNETLDSLTMTGYVGFFAYYFITLSVFYYSLKWLGWIPDDRSRKVWIALMVCFGVAGVIVPRLVTGDFIFSALGLPAAILLAMAVYLMWKALLAGGVDAIEVTGHPFLLIGIFMALVSHFIEVHFVFSIAVTYAYFWVYAAILGAMPMIDKTSTEQEELREAQKEPEKEQPAKKKRRRGKKPAQPAPTVDVATLRKLLPEEWTTWVGAGGLIMAMMFIIMTFNFVTPQFARDISGTIVAGGYSIVWIFSITWIVGLAVVILETVTDEEWQSEPSFKAGRTATIAALIFSFTSLGYSFFYMMWHTLYIRVPIEIKSLDDVRRSAAILSAALLTFYLYLSMLLMLLAVVLIWKRVRGLRFWHGDNWFNWLLYPLLLAAAVVTIYFKNVNVVKADIYLKQGEFHRDNGEYDAAILLHQDSVRLDPDEDFYYLMLALDYQLKAQSGKVAPEEVNGVWQAGLNSAIEARQVNRYNPDNTANLGRYYFTWGQSVQDQEQLNRIVEARKYFEKATRLAPQNADYHNLWAQTYYVVGDYDKAIELFKLSNSIDPYYYQTYLYLGDTYAATGDADNAIIWHAEAILRNPPAFGDNFFEQRVQFYINHQKTDDLIEAYQEAEKEKTQYSRQIARALGQIYGMTGDNQNAATYLEKAVELGETSANTYTMLGDVYLAQTRYEEAIKAYLEAMDQAPNNVHVHSSLGYIYAMQGRRDEAILENQTVLQLSPDDYDAHKNLSILYRDVGEPDKAIEEALLALGVGPESEKLGLYKHLATLYQSTGQYEESIKFAQSALEIAPPEEQVELQQFIAQLQAQIGGAPQ